MGVDSVNRDHERHEGDWHEWSTDISARKSDGSLWPGESPRRLFVRCDADCLLAFTVVDSVVTSGTPGAREIIDSRQRRLVLDDESIIWLRDALTKAIEAKAAFEAKQ